MNVYVVVTSALEGSEWLSARTGRFTPEIIATVCML
jgi:hypothetical protein